MIPLPAPDPLLDAVRSVLDSAGILGVHRVVRHCGRRNAIAVRGELLDCYALALEAAGYVVTRQDGWLEVTERGAGCERMSA